MEGFTPTFFLQLVIAIGSAGAIYGAIRADLSNMKRSLDQDREERKAHAKDDDESFHDLRNKLGDYNGRLSRIEGQHDLAERLAEAIHRKAS